MTTLLTLEGKHMKSLQPTGEHLVSNSNRLNSFKPSPVDCNTVILTVKSFNESSTYGSDGISLHFIKDTLYILAFYITIISDPHRGCYIVLPVFIFFLFFSFFFFLFFPPLLSGPYLWNRRS